MKEAKKFTCLKDRGVKVDGAPEGTKKSVLAWMKKFYSGLRKVPDQDMMPAWQFFYRGEITTYETAEGQKVYLAEVEEESESLSTEGEIDPVDEKKRETVLKNYKRTYAKNHPVWAKKAAEDAKALDEEVAAEVAMDIWKTAHLTEGEIGWQVRFWVADSFGFMDGFGHRKQSFARRASDQARLVRRLLQKGR